MHELTAPSNELVVGCFLGLRGSGSMPFGWGTWNRAISRRWLQAQLAQWRYAPEHYGAGWITPLLG
jgi:hypothetical protein